MFVLAHLSDPHIGPIPTPLLRELFNKRGLGLTNWYRKRHRYHHVDILDTIVADMKAQSPSHIAVTGDLVNISLPFEFARAARWLESVGAPTDVTLTPGNHDAYIRRVAGHAREHWGAFMHGDDGGDFPFVRRRGPVAIIGLTSSVPSGPLMATGRLGDAQLERLGAILERLKHEPLFRVVLIHHPPIPNKGHYMKRLIDAPKLRALLQHHGADLLLHGHNHEQQLMWLDGPHGRIPAVGVPSASAIISDHDEPAAYNLYRIGGAPGAWECEMTVRGYQAGLDGITELQRRRLIG